MQKGMGKRQLVDMGFALDAGIKKLQAQLAPIKDQLKSIAERDGVETLVGTKGVAFFSANIKINVDFGQLKEALSQIGDVDTLLPETVKVDNANAKKVLGPKLFGQIAVRDVTEYGKISFKPKG